MRVCMQQYPVCVPQEDMCQQLRGGCHSDRSAADSSRSFASAAPAAPHATSTRASATRPPPALPPAVDSSYRLPSRALPGAQEHAGGRDAAAPQGPAPAALAAEPAGCNVQVAIR